MQSCLVVENNALCCFFLLFNPFVVVAGLERSLSPTRGQQPPAPDSVCLPLSSLLLVHCCYSNVFLHTHSAVTRRFLHRPRLQREGRRTNLVCVCACFVCVRVNPLVPELLFLVFRKVSCCCFAGVNAMCLSVVSTSAWILRFFLFA